MVLEGGRGGSRSASLNGEAILSFLKKGFIDRKIVK